MKGAAIAGLLGSAFIACSGHPAASGSSGRTSGGSLGFTSGSSSSGSFAVGPHAAWPTIPNQGGTVLAQPLLVELTFDGDPNQGTIDAWSTWMVTSSWLQQVGADYGVSKGTVSSVHLPASDLMPGTIDDGVIRGYLMAKLGDMTITAAPNAVFELFFPSTATITENGLQSCTEIGGYHGSFSYQGKPAFYAVIPDCPQVAQQQGLDELQGVEVSASHEFIEACTDPDSNHPAWILTDLTNPWAFRTGEVADMCLGVLYGESGSSFVAQRVWSNTAAAGDGTPCIPGPGDGKPFYAQSVPNEVVTIDAGDSATIEVQGWSTGPVAGWTSAAFEVATDGPLVTIAPSAGVALGNDVSAALTVTMPAGTASGTYAVINLWQSPPTPDTMWWPLVVMAR